MTAPVINIIDRSPVDREAFARDLREAIRRRQELEAQHHVRVGFEYLAEAIVDLGRAEARS